MSKFDIVMEGNNKYCNYAVKTNDGKMTRFYSWSRAMSLFASDEGCKLYLYHYINLKPKYYLAMWK